jgi:colanic acid/amylovoran biosynthesis glycosyltransferase
MLGVVVSTLGKQSETYIAHHIGSVLPGKTVVCCLAAYDNPQWRPAAPVFEPYRSRHRSVQLVRSVLSVIAPSRLTSLDLARIGLWFTRHDVRVVLCEYLQVAVSVADMCRRLRIPVVAHAHGYDIAAQPKANSWWAETYRRELPQLAEIVVVSQKMKEQVLEYGVSADRVHVIACGTVASKVACRGPVDRERYKLVAVGRLIAKKGPMFLLEAFRQIRNRGVAADLIVIGDGPFLEPMKQWIASTGLNTGVQLLGGLSNDEVRRHLADADLFLQHSITAEDGDEEGLPVSILEAMAEGVPVVSTRHAGIPEAVRHGETGFLVEPGDCKGMADMAIELLADQSLRRRMGLAARDVVSAKFSLETNICVLRGIVSGYIT